MGKANAKNRKLKLPDILRRGGDGKKPIGDFPLTEAEKIQLGLLFERIGNLEAQLQQYRGALGDLINTVVSKRGLDTKKFGVNLGVGRILPMGEPVKQESVKQEPVAEAEE